MESHAHVSNQMSDVQSLVVPIDGSDLGKRALRVAAQLAERLGLDVHVHSFAPATARDVFEKNVRAQAREQLVDIPHTVEVAPGSHDVAIQIIEAAKSHPAPLLCLPTHGHGRSAGVTGSVATKVISSWGNPVMTIGPRCLSVPLDTSAPVVVALQPGEESGPADQLGSSWGAALEVDVTRLAVVAEDGDGLSRPVIAETIVSEASKAGAALIVMDTHARTGLSRLWNGSVAALVARDALCPVVTEAIVEPNGVLL